MVYETYVTATSVSFPVTRFGCKFEKLPGRTGPLIDPRDVAKTYENNARLHLLYHWRDTGVSRPENPASYRK